jgi:hypothetical protein
MRSLILVVALSASAGAQRREVAAGSAVVGSGRVNLVATNEWTIGVQLRVGDRSREAEYNRSTVCEWLGQGESTAEYVYESTARAGKGETAEDQSSIYQKGGPIFTLTRVASGEGTAFGVGMGTATSFLKATPTKAQVRNLIDTFRHVVAISDSLTRLRHGWGTGTCP